MTSKYRQLADALRQSIERGDYPAGSRLPSENTLSQMYSVSRQTVRHALEQLAKENLIVTTRGSGSRVTSARSDMQSRTVAVILSYANEYLSPSVLRDIKAQLTPDGYAVELHITGDRVDTEREILKELVSQPLAGVIVEGVKTAFPSPNADLYKQLMKNSVPVVFLRSDYSNLPDSLCVWEDDYAGAYSLAQKLMSEGHSKIGGFFRSDDLQGHQRYLGYASAMMDLALPFSDDMVFWYTAADRRDMLLKGDIPSVSNVFNGCSAVIAHNDEAAYFIVRRLRLAGIRVPEDVTVVSFDNSYLCAASDTPILSLGHANQRIGIMGARLLLQAMGGKESASLLLPWKTAVR